MLLPLTLLLVNSEPTPLVAVPYLGPEEPYFVGNGIAGAGGDTRGKWDFLIGPDYTSPDFLESESLFVGVDGKRIALDPQMHRAKGTGIFFGVKEVDGLRVTLNEFGIEGQPWICRSVEITNLTGKKRTVSVVADITPGQPSADVLLGDALRIISLKGSWCFGDETNNWDDRMSIIGFSGGGVARAIGKSVEVLSPSFVVPAKGSKTTGLYHCQSYRTWNQHLPDFRSYDPVAELKRSREQWRKWFAAGLDFRSLVKSARAANAIEGSLVACRSQQNRDGGLIAGTRRYANSYIRDSHGAVRLFLATGHTDEVKRAIKTIHRKWTLSGYIPNWWSMGSDSFIGNSFQNGLSEITGYYTLMVRDYYAATHNKELLKYVWPSVAWAVGGQLQDLESNGWKITFNGDETEQYCVKKDGETYGGFPAFHQWNSKAWSFPSAAIACASVQFYLDCLQRGAVQGGGEHRAEPGPTLDVVEADLLRLRASIDETFWNGKFHIWARYPDGSLPAVRVPNYGLIPLWVGAKLNYGRQDSDAREAARLVNPKTGQLPTAPGEVDGYCGHNLGYLLYSATKLKDPMAERVFHLMLSGKLLGCWGTVSEFYGPNGSPNGHNYRVFESGINAEALLEFAKAH